MNRITLGAALGGLAVYFYDPELGENRRERMSSLWRDNRNTALQAGRTASETIDSARPLARGIKTAIGRGHLPVVIERGRRATILPGLLGAALIGGTAVFFMDPAKGSARRMSALDAGRRTFRQIANLVEPLPGRVGDQVTLASDRLKSRVS